MKKVIVVLLLTVLFVTSSFSETIYLKNGKVVRGRIVEQNSDSIRVDIDGIMIKYYRDKIERIDSGSSGSSYPDLERQPTIILQKTPTEVFQQVSPAIVVISAMSAHGRSQGSGFVVDSNGIIVTNFHVVGGAEDIEVRLKDGRTYPVIEIAYYDVVRDICMLKIGVSGLSTVSLGNSNYLQPGSKVLVIGAPLGLEYSITEGLYSGKRLFSGQDALQFSAPISPGNSGGPLFDVSGQVVGITTFIKPEGQNVNFAIPINDVKRFFNSTSRMSMGDFATKLSKAYNYFLSAKDEMYVKNSAAAIRYAERAVEADPSFIDGHIYLSALYASTGRLNDSVAQLKKALAIDPSNIHLYNELGATYFQQGRSQLAIKEFKRAIEVAPREAIAYSNLAAAYEKINKIDDAIKILRKAIELEPDYSMAHKNLGWAHYRKKNFKEAVDETKKAILFNPYDAHAYLNLSHIYLENNQPDMAIRYCDQALDLGLVISHTFLARLKPYRKQAGGYVDEWHVDEIYKQRVYSPDDQKRIYGKLKMDVADLTESGEKAILDSEFRIAVDYFKKAQAKTEKGSEEYYYATEGVVSSQHMMGLSYAKKGYYDAAIESTEEALMMIGSAPKNFDILRAQCYVTLANVNAQKKDRSKVKEYINKLQLISTAAANSLEKKIRDQHGY
ncbi:MAG: tetratricopeptide repeat protein [Candidatus Omnitrophica bacterium]|nr:tetratricopeptide repeat protein [Candidatus Omnitrophota bacterium]